MRRASPLLSSPLLSGGGSGWGAGSLSQLALTMGSLVRPEEGWSGGRGRGPVSGTAGARGYAERTAVVRPSGGAGAPGCPWARAAVTHTWEGVREV